MPQQTNKNSNTVFLTSTCWLIDLSKIGLIRSLWLGVLSLRWISFFGRRRRFQERLKSDWSFDWIKKDTPTQKRDFEGPIKEARISGRGNPKEGGERERVWDSAKKKIRSFFFKNGVNEEKVERRRRRRRLVLVWRREIETREFNNKLAPKTFLFVNCVLLFNIIVYKSVWNS